MRLKTVMATILTTAMALSVLVSPAAELQADAAAKDVSVSVDNRVKDIPGVSIQTPPETVRLFAGLSWEQLESDNIGVRLNVTDSDCGPVAKRALSSMAASLGASEVKTLDMDLEAYLKKGGWTGDILEANDRIRVCIILPEGSDPGKDYAVISIRKNGVLEVLGDLDPDPATITVDSDYFDTFMIVAAPAGTFNAYRVMSPNALDSLGTPVYVKKIGSTVETTSKTYGIFSFGVLTDAATARAAAGGRIASLEISKVEPGASAQYALHNAIQKTNAENKTRPLNDDEKEAKEGNLADYYYEMEMKNGSGKRITSTNGKLRITMTVPYGLPAYADYAVAVLNMDGTVTIMKDMDQNESTITFDTDQFRTYVFLWGKKGAFDNLQ